MLRRLGRLTGAGACLVVAVVAGPGGFSRPAPVPAATAEHHAAVIVDTGREVKKVCVRFREESISGAEALRRAGVEPVFAQYAGKGEAVCSICGVGCPAENCFCDGSRFWAYHRGEPGDSGFTFSRAGASSTIVRDGDVEGWKWGSGTAPPYVTVAQVCNVDEPPPRRQAAQSSTGAPATTEAPAAAPPSAPTATEPQRGAGEGAGTQPTIISPPRQGVTSPVAQAPPAAGGPPPEAEVPEPAGALTGGADLADRGVPAAPLGGPSRPTGTDPAGRQAASPAGLAVFAGLLTGLLAWRRRLRRRADVQRQAGLQ